MRREGRCWVLLFAVVAMLVPAISSAATFGAEVFGAFNRYAMDDVNDALKAENTSGANFDELSSGVTVGLGLRMWANPNWMFSAAWEPQRLKTESPSTNATWNLDANSFQFTGAYFFPSQTKAKYGIGAGIGHYSLGGQIDDSQISSTPFDVEGSGLGFHFMGLGEWQMSPGFSLTAGAGYRSADIKIDNTQNGETANYSGFTGRVGLALYMPNK